MSIDLLPPAPDPATDSAPVFSQKAAAMVLALKAMVSQFNAAIAGINVNNAGGAYTISYGFNATGSIGYSGGYIGLGGVNQNTSTEIYVDNVQSGGASVSALLLSLVAGSGSAQKGAIRLSKSGDATKFLIFTVAALTDVTSPGPQYYKYFTVACVGYSSANPFSVGDNIIFSFQRTGDIGPAWTPGYFKASDVKTSGSGGGVSVAGVQTRTLNTVETNTITGASLSGNAITLPAGTYEVWAEAPAYNSGQNQALLYNSTDGAYVITGSTAYSGAAVQAYSVLFGRFTISATKDFTLRHWFASGSGSTATALGVNATGITNEVFAMIEIKKVA